MSRFLRIFTVVSLPIITLVLGWQLGVRYDQQRIASERDNASASLASMSGSVVLDDPEGKVDISMLWDVWQLLGQYYVQPDSLQSQKMVYGAVSGMVDSLEDPYTLFMTPQDTKSFVDSLHGTLEGIGAQLELKDDDVVVVAPLKGSPAEKAGMRPKDIIVKVNDADITGKALDSVVSLIRGPKGTTVKLTLERAGQTAPIEVTVTRDSIFIPSVESSMIDVPGGVIANIALNQFGDESMGEIRKALMAIPKEKTLKGVVLDLRFNGGGYLEGAIELVSMFQKEGLVVSVQHRDGAPQEHHVSGNTILPDVPLVVLINGGSASASEIAAGALQASDRATVIGTQSFGKGTVQEVIELAGGASLRVTIAKWLTPAGEDISKKGITPDIVVDRTVEEYQAGKDPQLETAVTLLTTGKDISGQFKTSSSSSKAAQ